MRKMPARGTPHQRVFFRVLQRDSTNQIRQTSSNCKKALQNKASHCTETTKLGQADPTEQFFAEGFLAEVYQAVFTGISSYYTRKPPRIWRVCLTLNFLYSPKRHTSGM